MAKIFITGSPQGLGMMTGRILLSDGHDVVLHARNQARADKTRRALPAVANVLVADASTLAAAIRLLAEQADAFCRFDAVVRNVAIGYREKRRVETIDGLYELRAVNVRAPYLLTTLVHRPARLVHLSAELHRWVSGGPNNLQWRHRPWHGTHPHSGTRFQDAVLAMAVARRWSGISANAVEPGWVPTRMGGPRATGDLDAGAETQAWLAAACDPAARGTGGYLHHRRPARLHLCTSRPDVQDRLINACAELIEVPLPQGL